MSVMKYLGKTTLELGMWVYPEERDSVIKKVMERGEIKNFEFMMRIKDGRILTCLLSIKIHTYNNEPCLLW